MSDLPPSRTERSLERVWTQLNEAFDTAVKSGDYADAQDLIEILDYDFPRREDLLVGGGTTIRDEDPPAEESLSHLDDGDVNSLEGVDKLTEPVRKMALGVRRRLIASLATALIGPPSPNRATASNWNEVCDQVKQALKGELGVLWLDGPSYYGLKKWLKTHPNALPKVTRRHMSVFHTESRMLLFPVARRLIARREISRLALDWEPARDFGKVHFHSRHHYELHMTDTARSMILSWKSLPPEMLARADEFRD